LRVILNNLKALRETTMVLRTTATSLLVMMMRAGAARDQPDTTWLLYGPTDPEVTEAAEDDAPPLLLAAE
jgi:hypothetical protein